MPDWLVLLFGEIPSETIARWVLALMVMILGTIAARVAGRVTERMAARRFSPQSVLLLRRAVFYALLGLALLTSLNQLGVEISAILGAAGVLTVAVGFASQTSAANVISGLFLLGEQSFSVGDVIKVGDQLGEVLSVDLLSVKLRTFDNLFVRVPNEQLLKSSFTNYSRHPIRRLDIPLHIDYAQDLDAVRGLLMQLAESTPVCMDEPRPLLQMLGFDERGQQLQFSVWAQRERFLELRNTLLPAMSRLFRSQGIRLALPRLEVSQAPAPPQSVPPELP